MTTVLEGVGQLVTPHQAEQIARLLGVEENQVQEGLRLAGPLLLLALNERAATPTGAEQLFAFVKTQSDSQQDVLSAITRGSGAEIVDALFGAGSPKIGATMHDATGFDLTAFLPVGAPLVLRALHNTMQAQNLDHAGLQNLLKIESQEFANAEPLLAQQIHAALQAGAQSQVSATSTRLRFTDAEWETLTHAPVLAAYAVMMAELSGPVGLTQEVMALIEAMEGTAAEVPSDSIVALVSREFTDPEQINALGANKENAGMRAAAACLEAIHLLHEKASAQEVYEYQVFVMNAATRVAQAAQDNTFLGFGGKPVSENEQRMLEQIAVALNYKP